MKHAIFAAGCFWGVELNFSQLEGVVSTRVGYTGGHTENPTYEDICQKETGHAEAVEVTFDPEIISYEKLLDHFWEFHDPTTLNRQGPDVGSQYRSAIFYHDTEQKKTAEQSKARADSSGRWPGQVVSEITKGSRFWEAEEYHQKYLAKRGISISCS